jgi:hypothetical protein
LIIKIEFDKTKITLSVTPEGVVLDAPPVMDEETRQTTLSDAQWAAYAKGREDERAAIQERLVIAERTARETMGPPLGELLHDEFPAFEHLVETSAIEVKAWPHDRDESERPPKVDPITGNIAGWVKTFREAENKRKRAPEAQPRALCVSSCCGTEGARMRDGSCWGCR